MTGTSLRRGYIDGPFGQIHMREVRPAGPTRTAFMCFHLSPKSGRVYENFISEMGRDRLCLAPDTPGLGASDAPEAAPDIRDYARCFAGILDTYQIPTVDLMGYHTGSKIAVELARLEPERVRKIVLVSAPVYTDEELIQIRAMYAPTQLNEDGSHLIRLWEPAWRWRGPCQNLQDITDSVADTLRAGHRYWWGHRAAFRYAMQDHLPDVAQPVLVLRPRDDLWEQTDRARSLIRNGGMVDLKDWGHGFLDYQTAQAATLVRTFLDDGRLPSNPV